MITAQRMILCLVLATFRHTNSHKNPVPRSKTPIATKSEIVQATSFVNCIAINGMSSRIATVVKMKMSLLVFIRFFTESDVEK